MATAQEIKEVLKKVRTELGKDPTLEKKLRLNPSAVLSERGLSAGDLEKIVEDEIANWSIIRGGGVKPNCVFCSDCGITALSI